MRKLYLQAFILGITIINPLSAEAATEALSAWEKWLARPSADAAQQVREIAYGSNSRQAIDPDMRLTRDLKLLEKRLSQKKRALWRSLFA